ncbi:type II secretion system protein GspD [Vulcanococcus limneticus]|uniref:type II secretion system protein GspD n=1 Tax=Vulcanococcus limneticus TaxID=2170428 RepID=UPI00398BE3A4
MFRTVSPICTAGVAVSLVCASGLDLAPALAQVQGAPTGPAQASPRTIPISARTAPLELRLDRRSDAVDVVISGVGAGPQLQQSNSGAVWLGRLYVATPTGLRRGTQTLSLPEAGFQSISLSGVGSQFNIQVAPVPGFPLGRPLVSADGNNLILTFAAAPQASQQTFSRDLTIPGRVPQPDMVPPLQPRAVAPPVGDMAVGSILIANSGFVNVSGPPITMTMQNAPARTVLMSLSRMGGYGFVYVNADASSHSASGSSGTQAAGDQASSRPISISFKNENYARALNSVLMASGLQGKVEGNTLLAGPNVLSKGFGAQLSKVYRLNQVGANSAADYLANLGARVSKTNTTTTAISQGVPQSQQVSQASTTSTTQSSTTTTVNSYGADNGPLLGLQATTDSRLSTITLVGSPALVAVAETYLRQLDLRQRQVALSVKILDVSLDNQKEIDNSFAFRYGNNFIVNDSGQMLGAFGSLLPPTADAFGRGYPQELDFEIGPDGKITSTAPPGYNAMGAGNLGPEFYPPGNQGSIFKDATRRNPGQAYPPDNFYNFLKAKIESTSTKVLASPTLILSENSEELRTGDDQLAVNIQSLSSGGSGSGGSSGSSGSSSAAIGRTKANESYVTVGEQVITNYTVTTGTQGNGNSCQPQFGIAGLTFGARVSKIDDNGFVTFSMSPAISATVRQFPVQGCGPIDILAIRRLDTGSARVRDGQTLILTGVISDRDTEAVTKWPILGDIPLIGQFFRNSGSNRAKRELVILVTPRIIDDTQGGSWGYGYQPSTRDARRFMGTSAGQSPY